MSFYRLSLNKDTTISTLGVSGNSGAANILTIGGQYNIDKNKKYLYRILGSVDINSLSSDIDNGYVVNPNTSQSVSSHLKMFNVLLEDPNGYEFTIQVFPLTGQPWSEGRGNKVDTFTQNGYANWLNPSSTGTWVVSGGDYSIDSNSASQYFETGYENLSADVKSMLNNWLTSASANYGFILKMNNIAESLSTLNFSLTSDYILKNPTSGFAMLNISTSASSYLFGNTANSGFQDFSIEAHISLSSLPEITNSSGTIISVGSELTGYSLRYKNGIFYFDVADSTNFTPASSSASIKSAISSGFVSIYGILKNYYISLSACFINEDLDITKICSSTPILSSSANAIGGSTVSAFLFNSYGVIQDSYYNSGFYGYVKHIKGYNFALAEDDILNHTRNYTLTSTPNSSIPSTGSLKYYFKLNENIVLGKNNIIDYSNNSDSGSSSATLTANNNYVLFSNEKLYTSILNRNTQYFQKSFYSNNTNYITKTPYIEITWNGEIQDYRNMFKLGGTGNLYFYNIVNGILTDIDGITTKFPGHVNISGATAGITSTTFSSISASISATREQKGIYKINFGLPASASVYNYFKDIWNLTSSSSSVTGAFTQVFTTLNPVYVNNNFNINDLIISFKNFKQTLNKNEIVYQRLFIKNNGANILPVLTASTTSLNSIIIEDGYYRILENSTNDVYVDWQKLEFDQYNNFFQINSKNYGRNIEYRIQLKLNYLGQTFIKDTENIFKII